MRALQILAALAAIGFGVGAANATPSDEDIAALLATAEIKVETFRLKNGLEAVVIPDHRIPVVTHMVWYRIGAADEQEGKSGIAHFLEHLMFKGTKNVPPGEYSKIIARNGGDDNAFTSWDYTAYYQRVALDRLPLVMEMEADRTRNLVLTDEIVLPERDVILEERRQVVDSRPDQILGEQMSAALYRNHRYGVPIIGWHHEIAKLTREDALDWYRTYYAPNNAILIVAGDVTAESVRPLAERTYGRLKTSKLPPRERVMEPPHVAGRRVVLEDERAEQTTLSRVYAAPSDRQDAMATAALDVAAQILGGSPTSRLYEALVLDRKLATSASASNWSTRLDAGEFRVAVTPSPGTDVGALEKAMDETLADFLAGGATEEEIREAKFNLIADAAYARDSAEDLAYQIGISVTTGMSVEEALKWPQRIAAVDAAAIKAALAATLTRERSVTGLLLPAKGE